MPIGPIADGGASSVKAPGKTRSRQGRSGNVRSRGIGESRGRRFGSQVQLASWIHDNRDRLSDDATPQSQLSQPSSLVTALALRHGNSSP